MSLFGSLQMAGNTLQAMQIGLHVVGNNIANANTPGYVRERAIFTPAPVQEIGNLTVGLGVKIAGIVQTIDSFVENRLRDAGSDLASAEVQEKVYQDVQAIVGELSDVDISSALTQFFNGIEQVANEPENIGLRNLVVKDGVRLAERMNSLNRRVTTVHSDFSSRVSDIATEINTLTSEISQLNLKIVTTEGGGATGSEAGGLRSQRAEALKKLSKLIDIDVTERDTGTTNVTVNGELLVFEATRRDVKAVYTDKDGSVTSAIQFADTQSPMIVHAGELHGIYEARDNILQGFLDNLDNVASVLAFEFNKLYSQGQGIEGFRQLTSTASVDDPSAPLNAAGLAFTPVNGSFNVIVRNKEDGISKTHNVLVDLNGLDGDDMTLNSLVTRLNSIEGIQAEIDIDNRLVLRSISEDIDFSFSVDSPSDESGLLAALGLNTFFTGSDARTLSVNQELVGNARAGARFAASTSGIGEGIENSLRLVALYDKSFTGLDDGSIRGAYEELINHMTQGATIASGVADGLRVFAGSLEGASQSVSGVNLDEEAIDMLMLQRTYQASARYISTISDLLDTLVNL